MRKLLIQNNTLTAIADAIREKTNTTASIFPENMPAQIRSIQTTSSDTTDIPEDIVEEANRVANGMISKMGANSLTFIAMSDMHQMGDNDGTSTDLEQNRRANLNAGQAAKIIADKVPLDFFANLGDLAYGGGGISTSEDIVESQLKARQYTWDVEKSHESFFTTGNHDTHSTDGYLTYGAVVAMTGTYRYVDFDSKKVRVICLNTSDVTDATVDGSNSSAGRVSGEQLKWFAETLDLSSKSNADSWKIVILSHMPLDWASYTRPLANCLNAYVKGLTYSTIHDNVSVSYNFSGKNAAKIIAQFHGHTHCFKVDYINEFTSGSPVQTSVKRVAIPQCCFTRSNEYGTNPPWGDVVFGESVSCMKSDDNTGRNTSFCLVSINLDKEIIYADCFGSKGVTEPGINAGYDRIIGYAAEEIVTYSITNNLANANTSNTTGTLAEGSDYTATITADYGYELGTITVTMGGADITSTAVNGNNITIANITGDVVITVTTIRIMPYAVSYDLANVESSNMSTETESNASYSTMLTADEGYEINFVRVLMGGEDITSSVYSNGNVNISTVTGDVDIIAGYYNNLVPTSLNSDGVSIYSEDGYSNDTYVSSGSTWKTYPGFVATGYIMAKAGDTIYVKGATINSNNYVRLYVQHIPGQGSGLFYGHGNYANFTNKIWTDNEQAQVGAINLEQLDDKYYKFTLNPDNEYLTEHENFYFRMSLFGTGEKLIITKNESIADVVTHTVTNTLSNVSNSNAATLINDGESYSATLTANDGYELSSVTVTMGGSDVTSTVYRNGSINITSVTGNIVITATATEIVITPTYTNLVSTAMTKPPSDTSIYNGIGYKNGAYISSGNSYGTDSNTVAVGFIACNVGDVIYIKCPNADITTNSHVRFYTSKLKDGSTYYLSTALTSVAETTFEWKNNNGTVLATVTRLADRYYKIEPNYSIFEESFYHRFSLYGTGEGLIITHNELIE